MSSTTVPAGSGAETILGRFCVYRNAYVALHIFPFWTPRLLIWTPYFGWTPRLNYTPVSLSVSVSEKKKMKNYRSEIITIY